MVGVPREPAPDFPEFIEGGDNNVMVTASSLKDDKVFDKIKEYVFKGGKVTATSGFVIGAGDKISDLTSIKYTNRRLDADEFQVTVAGLYGRNYITTKNILSFPLLEHRNNSSWSIINAGHGEYHESIMMFDTYGKGRFLVPTEVLTSIRYELTGNGKVWIDAEYGVSLFTYDNDTFGLYCYTNDGCKPVDFNIHIKTKLCENNEGDIKGLEILKDVEEDNPWRPKELKPFYTRPIGWHSKDGEAVFHTRMIPGDWQFFKIK